MAPGNASTTRDPIAARSRDLLDNDGDLVTVRKLLGHANVQTAAQDDRRGERAKKKAGGTLHVPYR